MIDTSQWRARIGHWNHRCSSCFRVSINNSTSTDSPIAVANGSILVRSLAIILVIVLILSGDIELNPGPGQPPQLEDVFRCLKSQSHMWQDIGRELKVVKKFRVELQQQGGTTTNDTKLEDVLYHWIESKCSDVSWDHLMKVLREELPMAATADKINEYLLNDPEAIEKYGWIDTSVGANSLTETENNPIDLGHLAPYLKGNNAIKYREGHCGWVACNNISLAVERPLTMESLSSNEVQSDNPAEQYPSRSPALRDIRCLRHNIECGVYGFSSCSTNDKPLPKVLSSIYESKDIKQCEELAGSIIDGDICMGRVKGGYNDQHFDWVSFCYFLQHSGKWNTIHLYRPDELLKAIGGKADPTIRCKKVSINTPTTVRARDECEDLLIKCINLFSKDELQEFKCNFMSSPVFYSVLCTLLEKPYRMKKIVFLNANNNEYCTTRNQDDGEHLAKERKKLTDAIAGASSLEELYLKLDESSSSRHKALDTVAILNGVAGSTSITSLVMENFDYSEAGPALEQLLKNNRKLEKLWLLGGSHWESTPLNVTELNTPLRDLDIFLPNDRLHSIVSKVNKLKSLTIGDRPLNHRLPPAADTSKASTYSLLKCCPSLTELRTSCDKVLTEIEQQPGVEQVSQLKGLVIKKMNYSLLNQTRSNLKRLEVTDHIMIIPSSLAGLPQINNTLKVLKIPVDCLKVEELVNSMKKELKNLKIFELRISILDQFEQSTGYDVTAGIFSTANTILQPESFPTLEELQVMIINPLLGVPGWAKCCQEADIKDDCVLDEFVTAVVSHPCIEYVGITLSQMYRSYSWISDIYSKFLHILAEERKSRVPLIEIGNKRW